MICKRPVAVTSITGTERATVSCCLSCRLTHYNFRCLPISYSWWYVPPRDFRCYIPDPSFSLAFYEWVKIAQHSPTNADRLWPNAIQTDGVSEVAGQVHGPAHVSVSSSWLETCVTSDVAPVFLQHVTDTDRRSAVRSTRLYALQVLRSHFKILQTEQAYRRRTT